MNKNSLFNQSAVKLLIKLLSVFIIGTVIIFSPLFFIIGSDGKEITLKGEIVEDNNLNNPIKGVEVRWMTESATDVIRTDDSGEFQFSFEANETDSIRLSLYHPDFSAIIIPIATGSEPNFTMDLQKIRLKKLYEQTEVTPDILNQISGIHSQYRESKSHLENEFSTLEKIEDPSLEVKIQTLKLAEEIARLNRQIKYLLDDSLLYSLREISRNEMLESIEKARAERKTVH